MYFQTWEKNTSPIENFNLSTNFSMQTHSFYIIFQLIRHMQKVNKLAKFSKDLVYYMN